MSAIVEQLSEANAAPRTRRFLNNRAFLVSQIPGYLIGWVSRRTKGKQTPRTRGSGGLSKGVRKGFIF